MVQEGERDKRTKEDREGLKPAEPKEVFPRGGPGGKGDGKDDGRLFPPAVRGVPGTADKKKPNNSTET